MAPISASGGPSIVPTYIDGKPLDAPSDRLAPVTSAREGTVVYQYHSSSPAEARLAASSSAAAFQKWKRVSNTRRRDILEAVARKYEERLLELATYQDEETSCGVEFGMFQVKHAIGMLRGVASYCTSIEGTIAASEDESIALVFKEPVGPVLVIAPWNGPLILATRAICVPIAAGCTVVLKASEMCPRSHHAIVEIFEECGLPSGVLNQIQARREDAGAVADAIIGDPAIRKVDFIGSAAVGKIIGQVAAKYLKPVLMELGGKGPALVLEDADLEKAAMMCAKGALLHHGQLCFSTERVIVRQEVFESFKKHLAQAFESTGNPGMAASEGFAKHAYDFLEDAKSKGAEFVYGGPEYLGKATLKPTIVVNVAKDAKMRDEETFGPSVSLYIAHNDEDAVQQANDSAYGLNAAIHTKDVGRALKIGRELEYAQVHVNSITPNDQPGWPIGGIKGSGWGRNNAHWGFNEFLIDKLITLHSKAPGFGS